MVWTGGSLLTLLTWSQGAVQLLPSGCGWDRVAPRASECCEPLERRWAARKSAFANLRPSHPFPALLCLLLSLACFGSASKDLRFGCFGDGSAIFILTWPDMDVSACRSPPCRAAEIEYRRYQCDAGSRDLLASAAPPCPAPRPAAPCLRGHSAAATPLPAADRGWRCPPWEVGPAPRGLDVPGPRLPEWELRLVSSTGAQHTERDCCHMAKETHEDWRERPIQHGVGHHSMFWFTRRYEAPSPPNGLA